MFNGLIALALVAPFALLAGAADVLPSGAQPPICELAPVPAALPPGLFRVSGIADLPDGSLVGVSGTQLLHLDVTTGETTLTVPITIDFGASLVAVTAYKDDTVLVLTNFGMLHQVDPATGAESASWNAVNLLALGPGLFGPIPMEAMTYVPEDDKVWFGLFGFGSPALIVGLGLGASGNATHDAAEDRHWMSGLISSTSVWVIGFDYQPELQQFFYILGELLIPGSILPSIFVAVSDKDFHVTVPPVPMSVWAASVAVMAHPTDPDVYTLHLPLSGFEGVELLARNYSVAGGFPPRCDPSPLTAEQLEGLSALTISEIGINADNVTGFIEVFNPTSETLALNNYRFSNKVGGVFTMSTTGEVIEPYRHFVLDGVDRAIFDASLQFGLAYLGGSFGDSPVSIFHVLSREHLQGPSMSVGRFPDGERGITQALPTRSPSPGKYGQGPVVASSVRISEVMFNNTATVTDAQGNFAPYIELFNDGPAPVPLAGFGILGAAERFIYYFDTLEVLIDAGGTIVVWLDGRGSSATLSPEERPYHSRENVENYLDVSLVYFDSASGVLQFVNPLLSPDDVYAAPPDVAYDVVDNEGVLELVPLDCPSPGVPPTLASCPTPAPVLSQGTENPPSASSGTDTTLVVGVSVPLVLALVAVIFLVGYYRRRSNVLVKQNAALASFIPYSELKLEKEIGAGAAGAVYMGTWRDTTVAIKKLHAGGSMSKRAAEQLNDEIELLLQLRHPNICLYMAACVESNNLALVSEFMSRGSLFAVLHEPFFVIDANMAVGFALDIARGMSFLHSCNPPVIHRDLKSQNVLLDEKCNVKITDFGLAKLPSSGKDAKPVSEDALGTVAYAAPEVMAGAEPGLPADVFAFAIVAWEIVTQREPYDGMFPWAVAHKVCKEELRPEWPKALEPGFVPLRDIAEQAWKTDPAERITFAKAATELDLVRKEMNIGSGTFSGTSYSSSGSFRRTRASRMSRAYAPAPTGSIAIIFTDIQGSTTMWEQEPDDMLLAIEQHNSIMRDVITKFDAYEVKTEGDAFMITCSSAATALTICAEVQRRLVDEIWPESVVALDSAAEVKDEETGDWILRGPRVRMGIHYGRPVCREDPITGRMDYLGPVINYAARVSAQPNGGQIFLSSEAHSEVSNQIGNIPEGNFVDLGLRTLKGIANDARVFEFCFPSGTALGKRHVFVSKRDENSLVVSETPREVPGQAALTSSQFPQPVRSAWQISSKELTMDGAQLGSGSYGSVVVGTWERLPGQKVAIKRLTRQRLEENTYLRFLTEVAMFRKIVHPSIVQCLGACVEPNNLCIVMEYMTGGSLSRYLRLKAPSGADGPLAKRIANQIAMGMRALHAHKPHPIIHRDLKSSNIVLDDNLNAKICDFGLARVKASNATMTATGGTVAWMAPELLLDGAFSEGSDVYAYAIVLHELLMGDIPVSRMNKTVRQIHDAALAGIEENTRPSVTGDEKTLLCDIMVEGWSHVIEKRPSFVTICERLQ